MHRGEEVNVVHGRSNHIAARVPVRGQGPGYVDEVHESSAEEIAERIGVIGKYDFRHFRLRFTHWARQMMVAVG